GRLSQAGALDARQPARGARHLYEARIPQSEKRAAPAVRRAGGGRVLGNAAYLSGCRRAELDASVAAVLLRGAERAVGVRGERIERGAVLRVARDADADAGREALAVELERRGGDAVADALGDFHGAFRRRVGQQHDELVAAVARRDVREAQVRLDRLGEMAQHAVARRVAIAVVDALQVIRVDHQHAGRSP